MDPAWFPKLFPQYENLQTRLRARILAVLLLNCVPLLIALAVITIVVDPHFSLDLFIIFLVIVFDILIVVLWHRRGLELAAHVLVFGSWIIVTGMMLYTGGLLSISMVAQVFVILMAALLTSTVITMSLVTGTAGINAIVLLLELYGGSAGTVLDETLVFRFSLHLVVMLLTAMILLQSNMTSTNLFQNLANSDRKFRALFEKSSDIVFLLGMDGTVLEANANASKTLGYEASELIGMKFVELLPPEDRSGIKDRFELARAGEILDYLQQRLMKKSGAQIVMEVNLALVHSESGKPMHYQSTARDITAKVNQDRLLESTLAHMAVRASTDFLTGVLNRDAVLEHAEAEWSRHKREGGPLSVLLVDMDRLKYINDTFGHNIGDQALMRLADTLEKNKRPYDWLGRYGGDEFMVVLPGTTQTIALEVAHRMRNAVREKKINVEEGELSISCSVGAASTSAVPAPLSNFLQLVEAADVALYKNKAQNKSSRN